MPFSVDIKHIPGPRNVVADALNGEFFVQNRALHQPTRVPYVDLLAKVASVGAKGVQDAFCWSAHPVDRDSDSWQSITSKCAAVAQAGSLTSVDC